MLHYLARPGHGFCYTGQEVFSVLKINLEKEAVPRPGPISNFAHQVGKYKIPIHSYATCGPVNDLVFLYWCTQLIDNIHHGGWEGNRSPGYRVELY